MMPSDSIEKRRIQMFADAESWRPDRKWVREQFVNLICKNSSVGYLTISATFERLLQKYLEPTCPNIATRSYHSFDHILDLLGWWRTSIVSGPVDSSVAFFAILYHDCVYRSDGSVHNEAASAGTAITELFPLLLDHDFVSQVAKEILTTDHSIERSSGFFVRDYDLVGLARDWEDVKKDGELIRQEYINVPNEQFYAGRKKFFESFGNRRIFESSIFQEVFSNKARYNIARIIQDCDKELLVH